MSLNCQFDIGARIVSSFGTTVRELHDHDGGIHLQVPIGQPRFGPLRSRSRWRHAKGDIPFGFITRDTGLLTLPVLITGDSWAQVEARAEALEADLWAEPDYFVETEIEGVTRRYITDVPSYEGSDITPMDLANWRMEFPLRFIVQPDPTTTVEA